ncbi:hypothetical protein [Thiorhodococcus minor]|nr:hypothetical protein [Thiorhodococcus minor]
MNLSTTIKTIQDIMHKDDDADGDAQHIGQLSCPGPKQDQPSCDETAA